MQPFNLLETGLKYDYVLTDFKNPNQTLYLVAFIEPTINDISCSRVGSIIIYNTFTRNTFEKWLLQDKDGFYIKIKVQYFEKKVYLHEFI